MVHRYISWDTTAALKKIGFYSTGSIHMTDNLLRAVHAFASHVLMSFSVDDTSEVGELVYEVQRATI